MEIVFKMLEDGAFVAGDRGSGMTSYAYPSSPHANVAKKHPKAVAEDMLGSERQDFRNIQAIKEYDRKNWETLEKTAALTVQTGQCCEHGSGAPGGVCAKCEADNRLLMDAVHGE